jgi:hypothetical protein
MQDKEQTQWLIEYLDTRLDRLEARLDASIQRTETSLSHSLSQTAARLDRIETEADMETASLNARLGDAEDGLLKISSQAGMVRNLLAFLGTAVLSLAGWAASTFLFPNGK